ncbi:cell division protein FtsL [Pseudaeromonas sp. ZJS20]|uniref:cell division protein FtsL n=1 Tax=Pseudaeromonas aegiceratis TaxID=3153928 RepID=UPI00390CA34D
MSSREGLAWEIGRDLGRHKFQLLLLLSILASAMTVIVVTNMTRGLTSSQNELLDERDQFDIEWRHLLLEQNALAEHSRVSEIARERLQMQRPSPLKERIVNLP